MAELTGLDYQIIEAAKKHFLTEGIRNTDMKQLASELGISRSTLYRHFSNSLHIAFFIVQEYLEFLTEDDESLYTDINGYDGFSLYIHRFVGRLCRNLDMVHIFKEFDALYSGEQQSIIPPEDYSAFISADSQRFGARLFRKGQEDGSIQSKKDPGIANLSFAYAALGMVERIMLREKIYLKEHGAAREFVDYAIDLMLSAIKA